MSVNGKHRAAQDLYSVQGCLLQASIIKSRQVLHHESSIQPENIFVLAPAAGTWGHSQMYTLISPLIVGADFLL